MTIEEIITDLAKENMPLLNSRLAELSNLGLPDMEFLKRAWTTFEAKRRRQIVCRLVELASDNVELNFDSIFKNCLEDQDADVRSEAIEGLWESEEVPLIESLINLLEQDSSEKVQSSAATALGKFALLAEHNKIRAQHTIRVSQALLAVINDQSRPVEVRRRALEAAAPLSLPQVKQAIMEAYQGGNISLRVSSIYAMGKSCNPSWLPILLKELKNADPEIRYEATVACGELEEAEAVPHLVDLVNDPDIDVQLAVIQTLGKIGSLEAKERLERCRDNASEAIRQAAEEALEEIEAAEDPLSFRT